MEKLKIDMGPWIIQQRNAALDALAQAQAVAQALKEENDRLKAELEKTNAVSG